MCIIENIFCYINGSFETILTSFWCSKFCQFFKMENPKLAKFPYIGSMIGCRKKGHGLGILDFRFKKIG